MASTTPTQTPAHARARSKSPRSRPTTPLRASSRSSLRESSQRAASTAGNALHGLQDGFAELGDAMADLEQNFVQLQLMHESLARFSESFAAFLYGMNMNAFCVDFPEAPVADSFKRSQNPPDLDVPHAHRAHGPDDVDATFLTTDTSFVDNPPSGKMAPHTTASASARPPGPPRGRGGIPTRAARARGIPVRRSTTKSTRGASGLPARGGTGRGRYAKP